MRLYSIIAPTMYTLIFLFSALTAAYAQLYNSGPTLSPLTAKPYVPTTTKIYPYPVPISTFPVSSPSNYPPYLQQALWPAKKQWQWRNSTASIIPYRCNFMYGGGYQRLLYVGRVLIGNDVIPSPVHYYGRSGSEMARFIKDGQVYAQKNVEWLCGLGRGLAWARVGNYSASTIASYQAVPVGFDSATGSLQYVCLIHSSINDEFPASVGTVVNNDCVFEAYNTVVNSSSFPDWHTLELLVAT